MQHGAGASGDEEEEGGLQEAQQHRQHHQGQVDVQAVVQAVPGRAEHRVHLQPGLVEVLKVF